MGLDQLQEALGLGPRGPLEQPGPGLPEILLRSIGAAAPPPGTLPRTFGGTIARGGSALAGVLGQEMAARRQDPTQRQLAAAQQAIQAVGAIPRPVKGPLANWPSPVPGTVREETLAPPVGLGPETAAFFGPRPPEDITQPSNITLGPQDTVLGQTRERPFRSFPELFSRGTPEQQAAILAGINPKLGGIPQEALFEPPPEVTFAAPGTVPREKQTGKIVGEATPAATRALTPAQKLQRDAREAIARNQTLPGLTKDQTIDAMLGITARRPAEIKAASALGKLIEDRNRLFKANANDPRLKDFDARIKREVVGSGMRIQLNPDGSFTLEQGPLDDLTMATKTAIEKQITSIDSSLGVISDMRESLKPKTVGLSGDLRSLVFGSIQQLRAFSETAEKLQAEVQADIAQVGFEGDENQFFDPDLSRIDTLGVLLAYKLARALDPSGRLAKDDIENAKQALGLNRKTSNIRDVSARLNALERILRRDKARLTRQREQSKGSRSITAPTLQDPDLIIEP